MLSILFPDYATIPPGAPRPVFSEESILLEALLGDSCEKKCRKDCQDGMKCFGTVKNCKGEPLLDKYPVLVGMP